MLIFSELEKGFREPKQLQPKKIWGIQGVKATLIFFEQVYSL